MDLVLENNRLPDMMRREMASLLGSTAVAEQRMIELLDKYGKETVLASVGEMIDRTEKAVRAEIAKWPEGQWSADVATDDDGLTMNQPGPRAVRPDHQRRRRRSWTSRGATIRSRG